MFRRLLTLALILLGWRAVRGRMQGTPGASVADGGGALDSLKRVASGALGAVMGAGPSTTESAGDGQSSRTSETVPASSAAAISGTETRSSAPTVATPAGSSTSSGHTGEATSSASATSVSDEPYPVQTSTDLHAIREEQPPTPTAQAPASVPGSAADLPPSQGEMLSATAADQDLPDTTLTTPPVTPSEAPLPADEAVGAAPGAQDAPMDLGAGAAAESAPESPAIGGPSGSSSSHTAGTTAAASSATGGGQVLDETVFVPGAGATGFASPVAGTETGAGESSTQLSSVDAAPREPFGGYTDGGASSPSELTAETASAGEVGDATAMSGETVISPASGSEGFSRAESATSDAALPLTPPVGGGAGAMGVGQTEPADLSGSAERDDEQDDELEGLLEVPDAPTGKRGAVGGASTEAMEPSGSEPAGGTGATVISTAGASSGSTGGLTEMDTRTEVTPVRSQAQSSHAGESGGETQEIVIRPDADASTSSAPAAMDETQPFTLAPARRPDQGSGMPSADPTNMDLTPRGEVSTEEYKRVEVSLPPETLAAMDQMERGEATSDAPDYPVREGYSVEATDGRVGSVERISRVEGATDNYLVVKEGLVLKDEVQIPFSAIDRVEGDTVHLNIDKQYLKIIGGNESSRAGDTGLIP